jgi:hypothetical protein
MKLCKDCRWMKPRDNAQPLCDHPTSVSAPEISLVTGETIPGHRYTCADMRYFLSFDQYCGREGRHWEAKDDAAPRGFV